MDTHFITLLAACSMLAACAQPAPQTVPTASMAYPTSLPSGEMTHPAAPFNDTGAMTPHMPQAGSGVRVPGSTDASGDSMAIPRSSMGTLRQPVQPTP